MLKVDGKRYLYMLCASLLGGCNWAYAVPPGFEQLAVSDEQATKMFINGMSIDDVRIDYNLKENKVKILNPNLLYDKFESMVKPYHRAQLKQFLEDTNNNHSEIFCSDFLLGKSTQNKICLPIDNSTPNIAFNPSLNVGYIILPDGWFQTSNINLLPQSTQEDVLFSSQYSIISQYQKTQTNQTSQTTHSINSYNYISYGNSTLGANIISNTGLNNNQLGFNQLYYLYQKDGFNYQLGTVDSYGDLNIPTISMIGASISRNYNLYDNAYKSNATPLSVNVVVPVQVTVYKDNSQEIIFSQIYNDPGLYSIDTSRFPSGSYQITLQQKALNGDALLQSQSIYFSNFGLQTPVGLPYLNFSLGYLQNLTEDNLLPRALNETLANITYQYSPSRNYTIGVNGVFTENFGQYINLINALYFNNTSISTQMMASNRDVYKLSNQLIYNGDVFSFNSGIGYTWVKQPTIDYNSNVFNYYDGWNINLGSNLSMANAWNASTSISINQDAYSLGGQLSKSFQPMTGLNIQLSMNVGYDNAIIENKSIGFGISASFSTGSWSMTLNHNSTAASQAENTLTDNVSVKRIFNTENTSSSIGVGASTDWNSQQQYNANVSTNNPYVSVNSNINWNDANMYMSNNLMGGVILGSNYVTLKNPKNLPNSGVIIDVNSGDIDLPYDVIANRTVVGHGITNQPTIIHLSPYKTYTLRVYPSGNELYDTDQYEQKITVYPNGFPRLKWLLHKQVIVMLTLENEHGDPLEGYQTEGNFMAMTNEKGFVQTGVYSDQRILSFYKDGKQCDIELPHDFAKETYVWLGKQTCIEH